MLKPYELRTEYKIEPVGMDELFPRFSYKLKGSSLRQSAFEIIVKSEAGDPVWDSGRVASGETIQIAYAGKILRPFTRYTWQVRAWDEKNKVSSPAESFFETGFLGQFWSAKWIGEQPMSGCQRPVSLFKNSIRAGRKIKSARLYITSLGLYSAQINGKKVSEDCFTPGWTQYFKRVQYQAYDVTDLLLPGKENVLSVKLAEGWYTGTIARHWHHGDPTFGPQGLLLAELHIRNADGSVQKLVTDESWETGNVLENMGEILKSDIYNGEHVQKYKNVPRWFVTPPAKHNAHVFRKNILVEWQSGAPVRRMMELEPVSVKKMTSGVWIVDFGQNFTGRERITIRGASRGMTITIRHGEMLYPNGMLYTENLRTALSSSVYESDDESVQIYEPEFTFYGFRYLEITNYPGKLTKEDIRGIVIYSDLPATGHFSCSDPLINRLFSNVIWGQRSNFLDIPTDCPQRDERMGWTGDTQVFANAASYNMFTPEFYRKWVRDLNLARFRNGAYPHVAPNPDPTNDDMGVETTGWSDAGLVVPWQVYRKYGDTRLLEEYLFNMELSLDMQTQQAGGPLVRNACFGDWLNIQDPTDEELLSSAYLVGMNRLLAKIARVLHKEEFASRRERVASEIAEACRAKFLTESGTLRKMSQTAALLFLHFGVAETKNVRKKIFDALVRDIFVTKKCHLSTGFLGTPLLLHVLADNGRPDLAYRLLAQTTYPGWLYPVTQGATTMWERWNSWTEKDGFGDTGMNSFNHYAYGAVADFFYENICGIQPLPEDPDARGFHYFRLAPQVGTELSEASAEYESMYGKISSSWKIHGKTLYWDFTIPCNTTAEIVFPGKAPSVPGIERKNGKLIAQSGSYSVTIALQ